MSRIGGTFSANQERHPLITLIDTHTSQRNVRKSGRGPFHAAVRYVGLRSEMQLGISSRLGSDWTALSFATSGFSAL